MAKTLVGIVSSDKADKTIVVNVHTPKTHPLYKKQYSTTKKFIAHDEKNEAHLGDKVSIVEARPISKRKRFTLKKIIERPIIPVDEAPQTLVEPSAQTTKSPDTQAAKGDMA